MVTGFTQRPLNLLAKEKKHGGETEGRERGHRHTAGNIEITRKSSLYQRVDASDEGQNTGLDRTTLSICVSLIENGVNPEALAVSQPAKLVEAHSA